MALSQQQVRMARLVYRIGLGAGLDRNRARELVAAAYAESGLNPRARGPAVTHSGYGGRRAAGLFQLLSSGYVNRANQLGGVLNPRANTMAILGDYLRYWQQNPRAAAGAGGAAVERSGQGASFYASALPQLGFLGGGIQPMPGVNVRQQPQQVRQNARKDLAMSILNFAPSRRRTGGLLPLLAAGQGFQAAQTPMVSGGANAQGAALMRAIIQMAQRRGYSVRENPFVDPVDPVHTEGSYHYQRFPNRPGTPFNESRVGRGVDISGGNLQALLNRIIGRYGKKPFEEIFYDPWGQWDSGRYSQQGIGGHGTHLHFSI